MLALWHRMQQHRVLVFLGWYLCLTLIAIALPRSAHLSIAQRAVCIFVSMATLLFVASLCAYFVEAWKRQRQAANRGVYTAWVLLESVAGIPFALTCAACAFLVLWVSLR